MTKATRSMEVVDVPEPTPPAAGQVVVRPEAVGICGSDFHFFAGELEVAGSGGDQFPRIQGHEVAGTVTAVGDGCGEQLRVGTRVAVWPLTACGACYPCRVGRANVCEHFRLIGIHDDGGLQDRLCLAADHVFPIASEAAVAALAEPVSIACRAACRARFATGERAVVFGAGPIGQAVALVAKDHGAEVLIVDPLESRLELGREMGVDEAVQWTEADEVARRARAWAGAGGPPVVVDATGTPGAIRTAVDLVSLAGRVVLVGMSGAEVSLRVNSSIEKELDMLGVACCGSGEFAEAVALVERHATRLERLISHQFSLDEAPAGLEYAMENPTEVMKVVVRGD